MKAKRTHVARFPEPAKGIDIVDGSQPGSFPTEAAETELMHRRQIRALKAAAGAWKSINHPELRLGSADWVRKHRQEANDASNKPTRI